MRFYGQLVSERLGAARLVVIGGPPRVGKTAVCSKLSSHRLDWNRVVDRLVILHGPAAVIRHLGLERPREATVVIENLHGHRHWRGFLRKLTSHCGAGVRLVVSVLDAGRGNLTGSCHVRVHPWSVGECARAMPAQSAINPPAPVSDQDWSALLEHGGFPEPFARRDPRFTRRWSAQRWEELIENDLPRFASVRDPAVLQMLALRPASRSATQLVYSDLSRELGIAVDTVRRWIDVLEAFQLGFRVRPWFARVPKAVRKEPRWFLRDWSGVTAPLARARTFMACHLLKAAQGWTDLGWGRFELRYVRDKVKREVDFLMLRNGKPWFLVEVAHEEALERSLEHFQQCTRAQHAFRVVMDAPYSSTDCFGQAEPAVVPARTLLSQLL